MSSTSAFEASSFCQSWTAFAKASSEKGADMRFASSARSASPSKVAATSALYLFVALRCTKSRFTAYSGASS